jgi:hypothetical protein
MEKITLVVLLLLDISFCSHAQSKKKSFVQKDMFSVSAGLAGGALVAHPLQDVFVKGSTEFFMEKRISLRADVYAFLPDYNFEGQLQKNTSLFLGAAYHFPYLRWDTYMSLQPGIAFAGLSSGNTAEKVKTGIVPVFEINGGVSYYIRNNLHMYIAAGYVHGNYYPEEAFAFLLDEVRIMGGIGINVFFNRYAPYERRRVRF